MSGTAVEPAVVRAPFLGTLFVSVAVAASLVGSSSPASFAHVASALEGGPTLKVVAKDLNNPRKIFIGPDGALYVVEAGTGGSDKCFGTGRNAICVGLSGSITRVARGTQTRVVTGLVSWATTAREEANGASDVALRHGLYDILLQDASIDSKGRNPLGPDGAFAGDLIATPAGKPAPKVIANLAAFEATHDPDHGAGPGPKFGDPAIESDPYAFTAYRGGFAVADASGNDLLWLSPRGTVSVLAVFPTQTMKLTKASARRIGASPTLKSIAVRAVPTSVAVGPDGALYVGELTGKPYNPGTAHIWKVVPGKKLTLYAAGFTNISDLAFDGNNLLVLEIAAHGLNDPTSPGALIRLAPDGTRTVLASAGLVYPTGLAVGHGSIYISNYGIFPGTGAGHHGEVVSLPASTGSKGLSG